MNQYITAKDLDDFYFEHYNEHLEMEFWENIIGVFQEEKFIIYKENEKNKINEELLFNIISKNIKNHKTSQKTNEMAQKIVEFIINKIPSDKMEETMDCYNFRSIKDKLDESGKEILKRFVREDSIRLSYNEIKDLFTSVPKLCSIINFHYPNGKIEDPDKRIGNGSISITKELLEELKEYFKPKV
jgi:hypothetical protein